MKIKFIASIGMFLFLSDEGPTLETLLDYTIRIGSTATFLYFDLYLYSAYSAHSFVTFIHLPILSVLAVHRPFYISICRSLLA